MPRGGNKKAYCYAVAKGRTRGIYFTWDQAQQEIHGFSGAKFQGFDSVAQATAFLESHGLEPSERGGWISKHKSMPILFTDSRKQSSSQAITPQKLGPSKEDPIDLNGYDSSNVEAQNLANGLDFKMPSHPVISIDSSPESRPDEQSSRKKFKIGDSETLSNIPKTLDSIQQQAIDAALEGKNIFLTGVAGTGKSFVTQRIVENAKAKKQEVAVAAPTGVAAVNLNLGAQTVHSLAGVKVPQRARDFSTMFARPNWTKWNKIEVLVIDEVGMLTADFLDWLDVTVRKVRSKPLEPFGGIQLIFVGDFAQLGPVPGSTSLKNRAYSPEDEGADCFLDVKECTAYAFQSVAWREADFCHIHLKKVYRQNDRDFIQALMDLRESRSNSTLVQTLVEQCSKPFEDRPNFEIPEGLRPTILYCTNWKVDNENLGTGEESCNSE